MPDTDSRTGTVRFGAALIGIYLVLSAVPLRLESLGLAVTGGLMSIYAFDPGMYRFLGGDLDPEDPRHGVALVGMILAFWIVVIQPLLTLVRVFALGAEVGTVFALEQIYGALILNLFILMGVPVVWALTVNEEKPLSRSLGFSLERPLVDSAWGVALALASLVLVGGINYLLVRYGGLSPTNPLAERLVELVDLRTAFLISLVAAVGEETFFRGFLQQRIGLVPAAVLFSIGHSSYGVATQILGPFVLGLVLGWVFRRRESLVAPVVIHFLFNFVTFYAALKMGLAP